MSLFIGFANVPETIPIPWYQLALWWGFVVAGILSLLTGLAYLFFLAKRHMSSLDILDDWKCTYWTLEKKLSVTLWFRDFSNSPISKFSCVAKFEKQTVSVDDRRCINGSYLSLGNASYGKSSAIMAEFFKNKIKIDNPNKAIITVSMKPDGFWAPKQKSKEVVVLIVNH